MDSSTGLATLTPAADIAAGIYSVMFRVGVNSSSFSDSQIVAVYIDPAAPTAVKLLPNSDTGGNTADQLTNLNNTSSKTLQFEVDGVISGMHVQLFADGTLIGEADATGTTVNITTNGTFKLTDAVHSITAKQTLKNQVVNVGNPPTTTDLTSDASAALAITVDTAVPVFNFTPVVTAATGVLYTCTATVAAPAARSNILIESKAGGNEYRSQHRRNHLDACRR